MENSKLPKLPTLSKEEKARLAMLDKKRWDETLTPFELEEYGHMTDKIEDLTVQRLEILIAFAQSRGQSLPEMEAELGAFWKHSQ